MSVVDRRAGVYGVSFFGCRLQFYGRFRHAVRIGRTFNVKVGSRIFKVEVFNDAVSDRLYEEAHP